MIFLLPLYCAMKAQSPGRVTFCLGILQSLCLHLVRCQADMKFAITLAFWKPPGSQLKSWSQFPIVSLEFCMHFEGTTHDGLSTTFMGDPLEAPKRFGLFPTPWAAAAVWWPNTPQSCWGPHSTFKHIKNQLGKAKERTGPGSRGFGLSGCLAPAPKPHRGKGSTLCNQASCQLSIVSRNMSS